MGWQALFLSQDMKYSYKQFKWSSLWQELNKNAAPHSYTKDEHSGLQRKINCGTIDCYRAWHLTLRLETRIPMNWELSAYINCDYWIDDDIEIAQYQAFSSSGFKSLGFTASCKKHWYPAKISQMLSCASNAQPLIVLRSDKTSEWWGQIMTWSFGSKGISLSSSITLKSGPSIAMPSSDKMPHSRAICWAV